MQPDGAADSSETIARRAAWLAFAAAVLAFSPILGNDFAWDDHYLIVDNPSVHGFESAGSWFFEPWSAGSTLGSGREQNALYWRPLAQASYALDWLLGGGSPIVFHATNLLLHGLASALVAAIASVVARRRGLGGTSWWGVPVAGGIAGLLFAAHPVHGEAVALATYRTTLLADTAVLLALWLHLGRGGVGRGMAVAGAYALGLMSKESALALPGLMLILDLALAERRRVGSLIGRYAPVLVTGIGYWLIHASVTGPPKLDFFAGADRWDVFVTMMTVYALYVRLMLAPWPLTSFYDWSVMPIVSSFANPDAIAGLVLFVASVFGFVVAIWRRGAAAAVALGLFLGALTPYTHILTFFDLCGERFLYLASAGPCIGAGLVVALATARRYRLGAVRIAVATAVIAFATMTARRAPVFDSSHAMLVETVEGFPGSFNAHFGLGQSYLDRREPERAVDEYLRAHAILPDLDAAALAVAHAMTAAGRAADAARFLEAELQRRALTAGPLVDARAELGSPR